MFPKYTYKIMSSERNAYDLKGTLFISIAIKNPFFPQMTQFLVLVNLCSQPYFI